MPPENVRYHSSRRALDYIKNTLPKCYDPPPKRTEAIGASTNKSGFRRFYLSKKKGLHRGWWKNNMRDGLGKLIDKNKVEIYEGEFRNDVPNGYGVKSIIRPNGIIDLRYEGEFANGAPNGKGNLHTDTYHYIGQINKGKASGVGIAWYIDGSIYFGTWFGGKRMGQGMIVNKNRNRYEGNWYADKKHGFGQYCFFDKGQALEGIWVDDICIRGTMRNIKYRQAATDPIKYSIPALMLKDWPTSYYQWEKEALARVGRYVREDIGVTFDQNEERKKCSISQDSYLEDRDDIEGQIDLLNLSQYSKYPAAITEIQPSVILKK